MKADVMNHYDVALYPSTSDYDDDEFIKFSFSSYRYSEDTVRLNIQKGGKEYSPKLMGSVETAIWYIDPEINLGTIIPAPVSFERIVAELDEFCEYDDIALWCIAKAVELVGVEILRLPREEDLPF